MYGHNAGFWMILCVPTLDMNNPWIEIKSLTTGSNYQGLAAPNYNNGLAYPSPFRGFNFETSKYATTDFIPSAMQTLNDSCEVFGTFEDETTSADIFNYGSLNTTAQASLFITNNGAGNADHSCYAYSGAGRTLGANSPGVAGVYLNNRRSNIDAEVVLNGAVIATNNTVGGSLTTRNWYLNTYNNNGAASPNKRSQSSVTILGNLGEGLSTAKRDLLATSFNNYINTTKKLKTLRTKQLVVDGNSHCVYQLSAFVRKMEYVAVGTSCDVQNFGVGSQTTTMMQADYVAEIASQYDGSLSQSVLVPNEITNDLYFGETKEDALQNYKDYCTTAQATGYEVVAVPMIIRSDAGNTSGLSETDWNLAVDWINQQILADWATFSDALAPFHPDAWINRSDYASDGAYNTAVNLILADGLIFEDLATHLTESSYMVWADQIQTAIDTL